MIIIADSGSTKTTWCIADRQLQTTRRIQTSGINPFYQNMQEILITLENEFRERITAEEIWFYGAGCANPSVNEVVMGALTQFFPSAAIMVDSDLMAAARSLCLHEAGIACILGTGSNCCYYDGRFIVQSVSPLGFILGDEGSGGVLGKRLLADVLKNQLPRHVIDAFFAFAGTKQEVIMEHIYRKPFPNRYAAGFTRFIYDHREEPSLKNLVKVEFDAFFRRNVLQFPKAKEVPVHFTGSIAFYFREMLEESAKNHGLKVGKIIKEPMEGLVGYHLKKSGYEI